MMFSTALKKLNTELPPLKVDGNPSAEIARSIDRTQRFGEILQEMQAGLQPILPAVEFGLSGPTLEAYRRHLDGSAPDELAYE